MVDALSSVGRDGVEVGGYACQQNTLQDEFYDYWGGYQDNSLTVSLGDVMAFYTLPGDERGGLMVSFQGGDPCRDGRQRYLNVTMLCDLEAGAGFPSIVRVLPLHHRCPIDAL